ASSLESAGARQENPIDAGVARLEANPYARSMIEATGMSVRDYVVTTLALAQAAQASIPKNRGLYPHVTDDNIRFVLAHGSDLPQIEESAIIPFDDPRFGRDDEEWEDRYDGEADRREGRKHGKRGKRGKGNRGRD
nr:hypothetical protein [Gemmatimonadaceae bacterium]